MFGFLRRKQIDPANRELARFLAMPRTPMDDTNLRYAITGGFAAVHHHCGSLHGFVFGQEQGRRAVIEELQAHCQDVRDDDRLLRHLRLGWQLILNLLYALLADRQDDVKFVLGLIAAEVKIPQDFFTGSKAM